MKTLKLLLLLTLMSIQLMFASDLSTNQWSNYAGKLNEKNIRMSLFRFANNQVRGHYYYIGTDEKIYLAGNIKDNNLKLYAIKNKKVEAIFNGKFFTNDKDRLEGTFTTEKESNYVLKLTLNSITGEGYKNRYSMITNTSTEDVETFAKQVKIAILTKDKKWLSENIYLPQTIRVNGKTEMIIKNKKQFTDNFERIFYPTFVEKVKKLEYFDMFSNYQGVMMGDGEIWINCISISGNNKCKLRVTTINN